MAKLRGIDIWENDLQERLPNFGFSVMFTDDERYNIQSTSVMLDRNRRDKSKQKTLNGNIIENEELDFIWSRFNIKKRDARRLR